MVEVNLDFQRRAAFLGISQLRNWFVCDTLSGFMDTEFLGDLFIGHFMACSYEGRTESHEQQCFVK